MIVILTTILVLLCLLVVMLILIQRTSGGMGSALGGGTADQVLGAGSAAQLSKFTVWNPWLFVLSFILYAFYQLEADNSGNLLRTGATPALVPDPVQPLEAQVPVPDVVEVPPAPEAPTATVPDTPKATENSKSEANSSE